MPKIPSDDSNTVEKKTLEVLLFSRKIKEQRDLQIDRRMCIDRQKKAGLLGHILTVISHV